MEYRQNLCTFAYKTKHELEMKRYLTYILLLLLTCLCVPPVEAASSVFRNLSVSDGLPDLVVNVIYKDSKGYVWMGTNTSVERFDGIRLEHYMVEGSNENLKRVFALMEMPGNELWVGTGMGLFRLAEGAEKLERLAPEMITSGVHAFCKVGDALYVGTEKGLYVYKNGVFAHVLVDKNVFSKANFVTGISEGDSGVLWLSTMGGLKSLCLSDQKVVSFPDELGKKGQNLSYYNITRIGSKVFMGTMTDGLVAFDTLSKSFSHYLDVGCGVISSLSGDGKDLLYVGTDGNGVHFISVSRQSVVRSFRHDRDADSQIRSNSVYSVLVDRDGLLWIGFYQLGVDYTLFQSDLFSTYKYENLFDSRDMAVRTIAFHGSQKLIGSRDGFVCIDEADGRFRSFKSPRLRASIIVSSCYFNGKYYIGTYGGGMYVLDASTLELHDFDVASEPFLHGHIFVIRSDNRGNLWIGTSAGLYCFRDGKIVRHYTSDSSKLPEGNVYEIYFDSSHKGWICTETGICIWEPSSESLKNDVFPEGFVHKEKIRMIYETSDHQLYFLPDKGELFVSDLTMNHFNRLTPGTLLDGKSLMAVVEDSEGWLWVATNKGMYRFDKKNQVVPFNFADGIPSLIFINCVPIKDEEGNFWFGNSRGLVRLNGKEMGMLPSRYVISLSDVLVNGKSMQRQLTGEEGHYSLTLENSQKSVTIQFSALTYSDPNSLMYEYKLGEEGEWISLMGKSEVSLYDLPSGVTSFIIRQIGYPDSAMTLDICIPNRSWLHGLYLFIIIVLVVAGVYIFRRCLLRVVWSVLRKLNGINDTEMPVVIEAEKTEKEPEETSQEVEIAQEEVLERPAMPKPEKKSTSSTEDKYRTNKVSPEECKRLFRLLEQEMKRNKPYRNPNLKVADLAVAIGTTSHSLSYLFNQYLEKNYYDYINEYRVEEFKSLILKDEYAKYTLTAMAELCGFSSRASFFRTFKKLAGITPNEYIKQVSGEHRPVD